MRTLYFWVLIAIFSGGLLGVLAPDLAVELKPLGDAFIGLIKMLIGPVIFCTVVLGISGAGDLKKVGRVGFKSLVYFEVVSTFALILGLIVANVLRPGAGFNVDPSSLNSNLIAGYTSQAANSGLVVFIMHLIPKTFGEAFTAQGDLIQILLIAILFGWSMNHMGERAKPLYSVLEGLSHVFFAMVGKIMYLAPLGAGGAMAFTIGRYGLEALRPLFTLMGTFYLTCFLFIGGVLGLIAWRVGFSIFRLIVYLREELLTVLGTSSSETVLVPVMEKLERLGCSRSVVGLVIPAGYSFNLDGTNIYLSLAALFIAQAMNIDLSLQQQLTLLGVAVLTSKGAAGVTGSGFITLAATLAVVPNVPPAGLALILGVDRFMSEARALTNIIGNTVATIVISWWEGELNHESLARELSGSPAKA